jgi:ABC-type iron transport system FetAB ATPase subunit
LRLGDLRIDAPAGHVLFEHANAAIGPGDRIAITGPSGAGKTTLLRALGGRASTRSAGVPHEALAAFAARSWSRRSRARVRRTTRFSPRPRELIGYGICQGLIGQVEKRVRRPWFDAASTSMAALMAHIVWSSNLERRSGR